MWHENIIPPISVVEYHLYNCHIEKSGNTRLKGVESEQLLRDCEAITEEGITYAALILFGKRSAIRRFLPQAEIVFEYRSSDASGPASQREEFQSGFFSCYERIWELINLRNDKQHYQDGFFIYDIFTFNERVVREAILNAICHADYSFPSNIKVEFFHTHCRISNPGPIYKYTLEEVLAGQQSFRNPGVVRILYMLGFIENYGSGLTRIINAYDKSALKAELLNMEHCFIVNLPNLNPIATTGSGFESQNEPQSEPQSEPQKAELQQSIIDLIKSKPKITRKEMSALLGKSMSTIFRVLKNNPNIKYIGSSKNGHWEIAEDKKDD